MILDIVALSVSAVAFFLVSIQVLAAFHPRRRADHLPPPRTYIVEDGSRYLPENLIVNESNLPRRRFETTSFSDSDLEQPAVAELYIKEFLARIDPDKPTK